MSGNSQWRSHWYIVAASSIALVSSPVQAQSNIVPDNTLGKEASVVTPNADNPLIEQITGGAQRGQNLFHSFEEFNVGEGSAVYFSSPNADIANILSRVTGNNASEIFGALGTSGASQPDLFLINPNGIIFGENASLNVGGSFFATTADSIQFDEEGFFSASDPETPPLLTVQPSAFLFNQINPGTITNLSTANAGTDPTATANLFGLRVPDGENFSLFGGDIEINSGGIVALDGGINIAAISSGGVELDSNYNFGIADNSVRGNVSLTNQAGLLSSGNNGGKIAIAAENIDISGNSTVFTGILSNLGSTEAQADNIVLDANNIAVDSSFVFNRINENATGKSGDLLINTNNLSITNGGRIGVLTLGRGDTGDVIVDASELITLDSTDTGSFTGILAQTSESGTGNVGQIEIETQNLNIANNARIATNTFGVGDAGDLSIQAQSLKIVSGAQLSTSSLDRGQGNAGNIAIDANNILLDGGENNIFTAITASIDTEASGEGGKIDIGSNRSIERLTVTNGAQILTNIFGNGDGGEITINASEQVLVSGENTRVKADLVSTANSNGIQGGNLTIDTKQLVVEDGAQVSTTTFGRGDAGNLIVNASEFVELRGEDNNGVLDENGNLVVDENGIPIGRFPGGLFAQVDLNGVGRGGNLTINTPNLSISDGSKVQVATFGKGDAGELNINAEQINIFNTPASSIFSTGIFGSVEIAPRTIDLPEGNGGDINIATSQLNVANGGKVSVTTRGIGNAGTLNITATDSIRISGVDPQLNNGDSLIGADVTENATGRGGDINIVTGDLTISDRADLTVSSLGTGRGGNLTVRANNLTLDNNAAIDAQTLTTDVGNINLSVTDLITLNNNSNITATAGTAQAGGDGGNINIDTLFIVAFPDDVMVSTSEERVVEAKGWRTKPDGTVVLVAENTPSMAIPWLDSYSCNTL
ncbi:filamentous hemagglutinin N-terminal domain-containing protein [Pleurocapsales cyanobacterium LEGE 10410]|nr:filamentous hemagglutinin N-terminal domain-containing protein [Pleurocapsales cyanobacterium LEGE 10410]